MNYAEAIGYLFELQLFGTRLGLEKTQRLAELAGNPQERLRFIHVAGTNGKGSTCAMLEAIYRESGRRVGLFTSPHLVHFTERIQVNRRQMPEEAVARGVTQLAAYLEAFPASDQPTFFEVVTVLALLHFAETQCDLVIWETGMGGRLDATNIVAPEACVITNVQLDHQRWLGTTLREIAIEKAGIIKSGRPIITAADEPAVLEVIRERATRLGAPLTLVTPADAEVMLPGDWPLALPGPHQRSNAAATLATVAVLQPEWPVSNEAIRHGLESAQWAGRFQIVPRNGGTWVLDGAHNPAGARALVAAWHGQYPGVRPTLVLGLLRDKDVETLSSLLAPLAGRILLTPVASERTSSVEELRHVCQRVVPHTELVLCDNLRDALQHAAADPHVLIAGSLYLIGEALELLGLETEAGERRLNEWGAPQR